MNELELYKNFPYAELKSSTSNAKLRIYILSYENKDEDWYENFIYLRINGMTVKITDTSIEAGELLTFIHGLKKLRDRQISEVESRFIEPTIDLAIGCTKNEDTFLVKGGIINALIENNSRAYIQFEFDITLEEFNYFISGLDQLIIKYPPKDK